jgi:hypothetical protein
MPRKILTPFPPEEIERQIKIGDEACTAIKWAREVGATMVSIKVAEQLEIAYSKITNQFLYKEKQNEYRA